eukprot:260068_1
MSHNITEIDGILFVLNNQSFIGSKKLFLIYYEQGLMRLLLSLNKFGIKCCRSYIYRRFTTSTTIWLKQLQNKLQYTQLQQLSVDESLSPQQNKKPRLVKDALFTKVDPTPLQSSHLLSISSAVTDCLDLSTNTS